MKRNLSLIAVVFIALTAVAQPHGGKVEKIAFSDDGKMLATYTDDDFKTKIWDTQTGELIRTIKGFRSNIWFTKGFFMLVKYSEDISLRIDPNNVFTQDTIQTNYSNTSNYYILKDFLIVYEDLWDSKRNPLDHSYTVYDKASSKELHRITFPKTAKKGFEDSEYTRFAHLFLALVNGQAYLYDFDKGFEPTVYKDKSKNIKLLLGEPNYLFVNEIGECKDARTGNVISKIGNLSMLGSSWDCYIAIDEEKAIINYKWVDKLMRKYTLPTFEPIGMIDPMKYNKKIYSVIFSPNAEKFAVLDNENKALKVFETTNGELVSSLNDSAAFHDMKNYEEKLKRIKEWEEEEKIRKQQQLENAYPKYVPSYWQFISEAPSVKFYGTIREVEDDRNKHLVSVMVHNQEDKPITVQFKIRIFIKQGDYLHITDHDAEISLRPKEAATNTSTMIHVNARRSDIQKVTIEGY